MPCDILTGVPRPDFIDQRLIANASPSGGRPTRRIASWLLSASNRTQSFRIQMTQDRLGEALGLQRTGVTAASIALQDAGAIKARHGRITIVDRRKVEAIACECHRFAASLRP
jgi:hypothetical protein